MLLENGVKNTNNSKKQISIFYEPVFEADGCITIPFSVDFGKKTDRIMIQSKIRSSSGFYDAHKWEEDDGVGSVFPVEIISERCHFQVEGKAPEIIPLISQKNHCYGFNIKGQLASIKGTLCFRCNDSSVSYMFNVDTYKSSERVQEGKE